MKTYDVQMQVSIGTNENYTPTYALKFNVTEQLPPNVDPQKWVRQRLAEEVSRNFAKLLTPIDNFTDEAAKVEKDPLAEEALQF